MKSAISADLLHHSEPHQWGLTLGDSFFAVARTTKYSGNKGLDTQDIVGILRAIKCIPPPWT